MGRDKREIALVTGASGFIGRNLCVTLKEKGFFVRGAVRNNVCYISGADECVRVGEVNESTDWQQALTGADTVIHLAARVHILNNSASDSVEAFRRVNVLGTERLAQLAAKAGVKRFIFISSVKVNGEGLRDSSAFGLGMTKGAYTEKDVPAPQDAYGISKMDAEQILASVAADTGLNVVVLRLPLVYGPGVKANFKNLIKIAGSGLPLPFKGINNRRSFLYLGNLVNAINTCITHPLAAGETFMVSDCADVSTPELIKMIALAMKKKAVLFYLRSDILKALCKIMGRSEELEKLTGTLIIDSGKIRNLLGWRPPFTMEEGIGETIKGI
jgi:nucleoside-diphosphate-sugar epimerase